MKTWKMNSTPSIKTTLVAGLGIFLTGVHFAPAAQNNFTEAEVAGVRTYLRENFAHTNACIVLGRVDERGARSFSAGTLDNGTELQPNGDTLFFIGSVSKTFTTLLLQDMVERGEVRLDDLVAKYLPTSVKMPARGGKKQITLLHLATHSA